MRVNIIQNRVETISSHTHKRGSGNSQRFFFKISVQQTCSFIWEPFGVFSWTFRFFISAKLHSTRPLIKKENTVIIFKFIKKKLLQNKPTGIFLHLSASISSQFSSSYCYTVCKCARHLCRDTDFNKLASLAGADLLTGQLFRHYWRSSQA